MAGWDVHKFGGTSVAGSDRYRKVASILEGLKRPGERQAVVVSAMSKVTDALIELTELARKRDDTYTAKLDAVIERHISTSRELLGEYSQALIAVFQRDGGEIKEVLRGLYLSRTSSERTTELIAGYGELWSAQLLHSWLTLQGRNSRWLDAREVLVVEPRDAAVVVDWKVSLSKLDGWAPSHLEGCDCLVITGFIASAPDGAPTTLKRNGSDYSASIFGALLKSREITIWTDVDGVLSADPRLVPEAEVLEDLSYDEATELAYFGAKVVHPSTMAPAIEQQIPIRIRNTFKPEAPGTVIGPRSGSSQPVKGFATIDSIALVNVEGTGMVGVPGVAHRLFGALKEVGVSVILISQASSEHSICFAVPSAQARTAKEATERAFFAELHHGQIERIEVLDACSILAAVGDNMVHQAGVAGRLFSALGRAGVSIRAIAQGSSERNISVVVDRKDSVRALRAAHAGFYLSNHTLSVGLIGTGVVGGAFLKQLARTATELKSRYSIDLRVRAIAGSKHMALSDAGLDPASAATLLKAGSTPVNLDALARHVQAEHLPHAVLIDCTSSEAVVAHYVQWLESGIHVVTPNKKANAGPLSQYRAIREATRRKNARFLYETNVGAGLPIINTLRDLVQTGDRLLSVEGVFSGTLSFLFNTYDGSRPFSEIVAEAKAKGYTEPDPRDDLSGTDVARKLVILAREAGMAVELSEVKVESLVPSALSQVSADEFMRRLMELDAPMAKRLASSKARGQVLRYVGALHVDPSGSATASVALREYPAAHAFARIKGSDNIVAFRTERYDSQALIVQGPGAGPEVTAAGVFADLLRLASHLGASL